MPIKPRLKAPELFFNLVEGGTWRLKEQSPQSFTMIIFYRGLHCPICSTYLKNLDHKLEKFNKLGVEVVAVSTDTKERAEKATNEWQLNHLTVGYGISLEKAREWNLFISEGINDKEPTHFAEPGLFLIKPDQTLYAASIQTMPFARPSFSEILGALEFIRDNNYPARGEV